jgi:hypothetical protein
MNFHFCVVQRDIQSIPRLPFATQSKPFYRFCPKFNKIGQKNPEVSNSGMNGRPERSEGISVFAP